MHLSSTVFLLLLLSSGLHSQIVFEEGYYVNNSSDTVQVLIKNRDWKVSPTEIEAKSTPESTSQIIGISEIQEFGIFDVCRYIRRTVNVDQSSQKLGEYSNTRNPDFQEKTIFLKVLIKGEASLYYYDQGDLVRFFFSTKDMEIEPLVFKEYMTSELGIGTNNYYKQQLINSLKCEGLKSSKFHKLRYSLRSLTKIFNRYNACKKSGEIDLSKKSNVSKFKFSATAGLNVSDLSIVEDVAGLKNFEFGTKLSYLAGLYLEYTLPFNKDRWSVFLEPTYTQYSNAGLLEYQFLENDSIDISLNSIDFTTGFKYNYFLSSKTRLFASVFSNVSSYINSSLSFSRGGNFEPRGSTDWGAGIGLELNNRYQLEIQFVPAKNVVVQGGSFNMDYTVISTKIRYQLNNTR